MKDITKIFSAQNDYNKGLKKLILNQMGISNELREIIISMVLVSIILIYFFNFSSLNNILETFLVVMLVISIYSIPKKLLAKKLNYDLEYNIWIEGFILFTPLIFFSHYLLFVIPLIEKIKVKNTIKRNILQFDSKERDDLYRIGIVGPILLIALTLFCLPFIEYPFVKLFATISSGYVLSNTILFILNFDGAKILGISLDGVLDSTNTKPFVPQPKKILPGIVLIFFNLELLCWILGSPFSIITYFIHLLA